MNLSATTAPLQTCPGCGKEKVILPDDDVCVDCRLAADQFCENECEIQCNPDEDCPYLGVL